MAAYQVVVEGLGGAIADSQASNEKIVRSARLAVDSAAERARTAASKAIRLQVNFKAEYLTGTDGRLKISEKATNANLERVITGRHRPTSLARFVTRENKAGVTLEVKPGRTLNRKGAFLMRLRSGNQLTDTVFNKGLAIRLKPGEQIKNKREQVRIANGLALLYGPSVDQVFRQVAPNISGEVGGYLEDEFHRLLSVEFPNG